MAAHETKMFKSGNSEAVRLPKGMGFGIGVELHIERVGDTVTIRPADPVRERDAARRATALCIEAARRKWIAAETEEAWAAWQAGAGRFNDA